MRGESSSDSLRMLHPCLMGLSRQKMDRLQRKACALNYLGGEGRKLDRETDTFHYINEA